MSKLKDYDLYFIHIPKNAGTSFQKEFCSLQSGHISIKQIHPQYHDKTICIVRNPYDRIVSLYNYIKMEKSYWHSSDNTTPEQKHELYDYCHSHSFEEFVKDLCINKIFDDKVHFLPQTYWVTTFKNIIHTKIIKFENLNKDLSKILNKEVSLIKINSSNTIDYESLYTNELKNLIYEQYKQDFISFNYNK